MPQSAPLNSTTLHPQSEFVFPLGERTLRFSFYALAVLLGAGQAWAGRFQLNSDGLNYLELGEAWLRGDWHAALNAYWSPLYPWLLGTGLKLFRPSAVNEFQFLHSVDFFIYLGTLLCFDFFLARLIQYHRYQRATTPTLGLAVIPKLIWILFGYTLFLVASIRFISVSLVIPDMCVAAFIFLATGVLLRIHSGSASVKNYFILGVILGLGYLSKTAVLPLSFVFILSSFVRGISLRKTASHVAASVAGLALVAAPFIMALSFHQGYLTYGETGKLAYASMVNHLPQAHWQGGPPGFGKPLHPSRKIFDLPAAFEFATPIPGTNPPAYDPAYWNEGVIPHFDLQAQIARVKTSLPRIFDIFLGRFSAGLLAGILMLYIFTPTLRRAFRSLASQWFLFLPPAAAFMMYGLVLVETRYVGAYYVIFCTGLLAGVPLPDSPDTKKWAITVTAQVVSASLLILLILTATEVIIGAKEGPEQWRVAEFLQEAGLSPGDRVAEIGCGGMVGWARLARVRITAEIPPESMGDYNQAGAALRSNVVSALFRTGVKAVVSGIKQEDGCPTAWREVGNTSYSVCTPSERISGALAKPLSGNY